MRIKKILPLKQIMPKQINPPSSYQFPAGKTHDFPNPIPMAGPIAMDRAVLATRFRVKRTVQPPVNRVKEELLTLLATAITIKGTEFNRKMVNRRTWSSMMRGTENRGKEGEDFEIFALTPSKAGAVI